MNKQENIPALRFPEFTGNWVVKKLGEIASFSKGKGISKVDISENGITECIRYGELYTHYQETINDIKSKTNIDVSDLVFSEANDIIIPASGESEIDIATASCVLKSGVALGGDLNIIRTENNGVFLSYYLNNKKKYDIANLAQGVSVVHLYSSQLSLLKVLFPSLPEQQKIATFLSSVDEKLQGLKKKKSLLEAYKKGMMQRLFSQTLRFKDENGEDFPEWEEKTLGDYIDVISGIALKGEDITENKSGTPILRGINITEGYIRHSSEIDRFFLTNDMSSYKKFLLKETDIVLGMDGSKVGKNVSLIGLADAGSILIQRVARIRATDKSDIHFIYQSIYSKSFQDYVDVVNTSSGIPHISLQQIKDYELSFPSLSEQTKIANFLSAIDEKIAKVSEEIEQATVWKKGLLQQLFV